MRTFLRAALFLVTLTSVGLAQPASTDTRPIMFTLGLGPSHAFRGVDARGIEWQGGAEHALGRNFGLRLEGTGHWYAAQPLYPCMVQDAQYCYQTMRRSVSAGVLNATYQLTGLATDKGRSVPYLITGVGIYRSRRLATHYPDCQPTDLCDQRATSTLEIRDTQLGWSGGVGANFDIGPVAAFSELRLHYIYRDTPSGQASNDYFLWPLSIGFRF
jgi:hypothetical protein